MGRQEFVMFNKVHDSDDRRDVLLVHVENYLVIATFLIRYGLVRTDNLLASSGD
jgi:hypothetical protein